MCVCALRCVVTSLHHTTISFKVLIASAEKSSSVNFKKLATCIVALKDAHAKNASTSLLKGRH